MLILIQWQRGRVSTPESRVIIVVYGGDVAVEMAGVGLPRDVCIVDHKGCVPHGDGVTVVEIAMRNLTTWENGGGIGCCEVLCSLVDIGIASTNARKTGAIS